MAHRPKDLEATIDQVLNPVYSNDLKARRKKLKLSRHALARILDVDPATIYRQECGALSALWDYALRGIEAEAKDDVAAEFVRAHQDRVDQRNRTIPDAIIKRRYRLTGERMKALKPRPPRPPRHKPTAHLFDLSKARGARK